MEVRTFGRPIEEVCENALRNPRAVTLLQMPAITAPQAVIYRTFFPECISVTEWWRCRIEIPGDVHREIAFLQQLRTFDKIEIWAPRGSINDPMLVCWLDGVPYFRMQWGDPVIDFVCIRIRTEVWAEGVLHRADLFPRIARDMLAIACAAMVFQMFWLGLALFALFALVAIAAGENRIDTPKARAVLDAARECVLPRRMEITA